MRRFEISTMPFVLLLGAGVALSACGDDEPSDDTDVVDTQNDDADASGTPDNGGETIGDGDDGGEEEVIDSEGWTLASHECTGNEVDTLYGDADGTLYVGCGSDSAGDVGVFLSTDDGATWAKPTTQPIGFFDTWRVHDVWRGSDDLLYVSGRDTAGSRRTVSADTSAATWTLEEVYNAGSIVGSSFDVATFRRDTNGRAAVEALNGSHIQMRDSDTDDWSDASGWSGELGTPNIFDLEVHNGQFFGSGSRISEPPQLFVEDTDAATFTMTVTELASGIGAFDGEMWAIDVDDSGIVLGGVNQDADAGVIYVVADPDDTSDTIFYDLRTLFPDDTTWIRDVCRDGDFIVAVGEFSSKGDGIVLVSTDGGTTWADDTPVLDSSSDNFSSAKACELSDDHIYVATTGGTLAVQARD